MNKGRAPSEVVKAMRKRLMNWIDLDEHEIGRPHFKMKNPVPVTDANTGLLIAGLETIKQDLYDFWQSAVNSTLTAQTLFATGTNQPYTPIGGTAFAKQLLHTNVQGNNGQLPNPQSFMMKGLMQIIDPLMNPTDIRGIEFQMQASFFCGDSNKHYYDGLLLKIPQACGMFINGTPASNATFAGMGWPHSDSWYPLLADGSDPGVSINQGQNFGFTLDPTQVVGGAYKTLAAGSGGVTSSIYIYLVGSLTRGVQ